MERERNIPCHVMSCHVMSCHVMSCHVMSCHVMSCHVMSCHVMSYVCHKRMQRNGKQSIPQSTTLITFDGIGWDERDRVENVKGEMMDGRKW